MQTMLSVSKEPAFFSFWPPSYLLFACCFTLFKRFDFTGVAAAAVPALSSQLPYCVFHVYTCARFAHLHTCARTWPCEATPSATPKKRHHIILKEGGKQGGCKRRRVHPSRFPALAKTLGWLVKHILGITQLTGIYKWSSDATWPYRKCSELERVPRCCYLAFAYAASSVNLPFLHVFLHPFLSQCTFCSPLESATSFSHGKLAAAHAVIT